MNTTVVTARGQVAIPVIIRQRLNIRKGTRLYVETRNDEIILKAVKSEYFAGIPGILLYLNRKIFP
ncbi:MAG TPA: AbrB/MazE/SpoVT family DNA-binding domain-containing protein [Candidatus Kapabacteria bacterium]|nr:AbrB/MazE/SpoVT family DNA-binding domain-containing protein [Candidatus Kapabacteria bacterium]